MAISSNDNEIPIFIVSSVIETNKEALHLSDSGKNTLTNLALRLFKEMRESASDTSPGSGSNFKVLRAKQNLSDYLALAFGGKELTHLNVSEIRENYSDIGRVCADEIARKFEEALDTLYPRHSGPGQSI